MPAPPSLKNMLSNPSKYFTATNVVKRNNSKRPVNGATMKRIMGTLGPNRVANLMFPPKKSRSPNRKPLTKAKRGTIQVLLKMLKPRRSRR